MFIKTFFIVGLNGFGTWTNAIYNCIVNGSLLKKESDDPDHWLSYFKYEDGKVICKVLMFYKVNSNRLHFVITAVSQT